MARLTSRSWTQDDIARLKKLSASGASVMRAAAALGRKTGSVTKMARLHGLPLVGTRQAKAAIRELEQNSTTLR
jgi:hypothetical protein